MGPHRTSHRTSIVMTTRDRRDRVLRTLPRLLSLPEVAEVIVVDDASRDDTTDAVSSTFPEVTVLRLEASRGAAARNVGVERAATPYVAFADDDSWWAARALGRAADILDGHPEIGLLAARVLVGPDRDDDPTNALMADSPLGSDGLPGPEILGFVACGAVVRRSAFLEVGGFHPRLHIGGEEELVALDLRRAGWRCVYVDDVVAHHAPDAGDPRPGRRRRLARNALWTAWLRRPVPAAARVTARIARSAVGDGARAAGMIEALRGVPWVARERERLPDDVERARRALDPG